MMIDSALHWLALGVLLVPLQPKSKYIVRGFGPHLRQLATPNECRYWFLVNRANLGLVCGGRAGLLVLDFDAPGDYYQWRTGAGDLAQTFTVVTLRGFHVYFFAGDLPSGRSGSIEVKGHGSVVIAAPSVHPSGLIYRPLVEVAPVLHIVADDLSLLSELCKEKSARRIVARVQAGGTGNDLIARIKAAWPLLPLARSIALKRLTSRDGRWWHGLCPFHPEREPSFWVDAERGLWGCYSCQIRGDAINLYARHHGLTVQEAIREMACSLHGGAHERGQGNAAGSVGTAIGGASSSTR